MDNHPIPQDVTGFKFRLIGSITVRQFSYLLFASIVCYLFFILPVFVLIKIPFIGIFAALGFMLAFVPIDGRPMDLMFMNFLRAIPRDNQWIYQKKGVDLSFLDYHPVIHQPHSGQASHADEAQKRQKLAQLLASRNSSNLDIDKHEVDFLEKMKGFFAEQALDQPSSHTLPPAQPSRPQIIVDQKAVSPPPQPTPQQSINTISMSSVFPHVIPQSSILQTKPEEPPQENSEKKATPPQEALPEQPKPQPISEKKEPIPEEMMKIEDTTPHAAVSQIAKEINHQKATAGTPTQDTSRVRSLTGDTAIQAGYPILPDIPNILLGIVKDPRGKVLSNILVEIFDKNDIPVRAFKTNPLGQFASATPLPDGSYTIRLEDPQAHQEFDTIEITLAGEIFQPLEIISIDSREKLRLELFG